MIKEAAIKRISDSKVWTGKRHGNIIRKIVKEEDVSCVLSSEFIQGFMTDEGLFVDRYDAFVIATECNQLLNPKDPWAVPTLMSEDLY